MGQILKYVNKYSNFKIYFYNYLQISKKYLIFAEKFYIMKKGKDNLVFKYVFRPAPGGRDFICDIDGDIRMLSEFFPYIFPVACHCSSNFNLTYDNGHSDITSWIDKHGNVIVRVIDNSIKQTKIDF